MKDLAKCPFCKQDNAEVIVDINGEHLDVFVHCWACGGRGGSTEVHIADNSVADVVDGMQEAQRCAIEDWNLRKK